MVYHREQDLMKYLDTGDTNILKSIENILNSTNGNDVKKKLQIIFNEDSKNLDLIKNILEICLDYVQNFKYAPEEMDAAMLCLIDSTYLDNLPLTSFDSQAIADAKTIMHIYKKLLSGQYDIFQKKEVLTNYLSTNFTVTKISILYFLKIFKNLSKYDTFIVNQLCELAHAVYIPLMHVGGLREIKTTVEDICMEVTNNYGYTHVLKKNLDRLNSIKKIFLLDFCNSIKKNLSILGCNMQITHRTKSISSIWHKLESQDMPHEDLHDYLGIRIILDTSMKNEKELCYKAYKIIKSKYKIDERKTRDWISKPKESGYTAIHVTVVYNSEVMIEVQIRSTKMHEVAENGPASHWNYKGKKSLSFEVTDDIIENLKETKKGDQIL